MISGRVSKADVERHLREHGIKPSVQRVAVMEYLANHRTHPTIDEIYTAIAPTMTTLSRTTVYNTLHLLVDENVVKVVNIEENVCHFDADMSNHAHYQCKICGKIFDLMENDVPVLANIKTLVENDERFDSAELYLRGVCPKCIEKQNKKAKR